MVAGFGQVRWEDEYAVPHTRAGLADYLLSQSNAGAAIEAGQVTEAGLVDQILTETASFFGPEDRADVIFGMRSGPRFSRLEHARQIALAALSFNL
jgi:hypothetical protein